MEIKKKVEGTTKKNIEPNNTVDRLCLVTDERNHMGLIERKRKTTAESEMSGKEHMAAKVSSITVAHT